VALHVTSPSLLILGTDAVYAASPATPVQLAHACLAAGYRSVVPVSWGDEILARRIIDAVKNTNGPLVLCCCPLVTRRLAKHADDIGSMMLSCVSPPVATAAYLRALYAPAGVRITFVGGCPSGGHASIDAWLTPAELLADLANKGIQLAEQPTEFDSVLPPDRRRHFSEPGGAPSRDLLRRATGAPELVDLESNDFAIDLAQALLAGGPSLVDAAPVLGCVCSGAATDIPPQAARARVRLHEPPRAPSPVVDHDVELGVDIVTIPESHERAHAAPTRTVMTPGAPIPAPTAPAVPIALTGEPPEQSVAMRAPAANATAAVASPPQEDARRRSATGNNRAVIGAMPQSRSSGRHLPRAYVARRRSSPKGIRQSGVRRQIEVLGPYRDQPAIPRWIWFVGVGTVVVAVAALLVVLAGR
jgi:hypothetical protein